MYVGGGVPGADVALAGERGDGDGVFQLVLGEVVRDSSVHVALWERQHSQEQLKSSDFDFSEDIRMIIEQVTSHPEVSQVCFY